MRRTELTEEVGSATVQGHVSISGVESRSGCQWQVQVKHKDMERHVGAHPSYPGSVPCDFIQALNKQLSLTEPPR